MNLDIWPAIGQSSHNTHDLKTYQHYFKKYRENFGFKHVKIIDPFARKCPWGTHRNDINPTFLEEGFTNSCSDALDFVRRLKTNDCEMILLDPPFSDRQSKEEYGSPNLYTNPKYMAQLGAECFRI